MDLLLHVEQAIEKVLSAYNEALNSLADSEKADLQRRIGLKVHELRAQYDDLTKEDVEGDDH